MCIRDSSYILIKGELKYNPMGGMNVSLVINGDKKLTIDTTVQMEDSGQFEAGSYGISAKLDDLLSKAEETGKKTHSVESFMETSKENRNTKIRWTLWLLLITLCLGGCSLITGRSTKKREMIQIAESKQSKRVLENILRQEAVSYTHLRAHETRHDLVCRLLLEKKKKKKSKQLDLTVFTFAFMAMFVPFLLQLS